MTPTYPGSGGTRTSLYRDRIQLQPDIPILASQHNLMYKRGGCTFKQQTPGTGTNEVQTIAASAATAGTFRLGFAGWPTLPAGAKVVTDALPFGATAAQVQTALQALDSIGPGNVTVAGGPANSGALVVTFANKLAKTQIPFQITVDKTGLTGAGATAVTETTKGSPANVVEIPRGTFCIPDPSNPGYYRPWVAGDTIDDTQGLSGFLPESINVAFGDVLEGIIIAGSLLGARLSPAGPPAAVRTATAGRISYQ